MHHRLHFSFKLHKPSCQIFLLGAQRNFSFPLKGFYFEKNHGKIWGHYGMLVEKGNQNGEECTWRWSLLETCFWHCDMRWKDIIFGVLLKQNHAILSIHPRKFTMQKWKSIAITQVNPCDRLNKDDHISLINPFAYTYILCIFTNLNYLYLELHPNYSL